MLITVELKLKTEKGNIDHSQIKVGDLLRLNWSFDDNDAAKEEYALITEIKVTEIKYSRSSFEWFYFIDERGQERMTGYFPDNTVICRTMLIPDPQVARHV